MADFLDTQLDSDLDLVTKPDLSEKNTHLIGEVLAILRSIDEGMDEGYMMSIADRVQIVWEELICTGKVSKLSGVTKTRIEEIVRKKNEYKKFMAEGQSESKQRFESEGLLQEA